MSRNLPGSGRRSGSGRPGRMCALRSAAFRKERRRLREIPPRRTLFRTGCPRNCRREQENVRQRSSGMNVRPVQRGIPKGAAPTAGNPSAADAFPHGMSPDLPGSRRTSGSGGRRRVRKTAGSRKIDENLIFGTRAFVFYPLSLAAPKILRLNKIANKFAFVSGLFVSLRLKPKYANRP